VIPNTYGEPKKKTPMADCTQRFSFSSIKNKQLIVDFQGAPSLLKGCPLATRGGGSGRALR
jgi:hypothetical protein